MLDFARVNRPVPTCRRVLLKLSGEALLRDTRFGIERAMLDSVSREVAKLVDIGVQVAMVIGAGNIFRGSTLVEAGIERVTADQIGMLGIMNALALQDAMESHGMTARVMSGIRVNQFCEEYIRRRAVRHLEKGRVVVFRRRHRKPLLHDGHRGLVACNRDRCRSPHQGDQGGWGVLGRSEVPSRRPALPPSRV